MTTSALILSECSFEQRSEAWRMARCGKVTGSMIGAVLAKAQKGKDKSACRSNYIAQIVAEVLTGKPCDSDYLNHHMQWGIDQEPFARAAYEMEKDVIVDTVGFVDHPRIEAFGASPDGIVGDDGLVQFKCPLTATHLDYLLSGEVPMEYRPQMYAEMACTGRAWCDFVSFDPRMPRHLQLFVKRLPRDEAKIVEIEHKVEEFLEEVRHILNQLTCLESSLEVVLKKSLDQVKRGPQAVVSVMDRKLTDEVEA